MKHWTSSISRGACLATVLGCGGSERDPAVMVTASPDPAERWFEEVAAASGLDFVHVAHHVQRFWMPEISPGGVAFLDYDGDGDVVYMDLHEPVRLLRNVAPKRGGWIGLRLLNRHGSDALGATARIETPAGLQYRLCHTAYSYCSANDPRVHFGLGAADAVSGVRITWPDRKVEEFGPLPAGEYHTLRQGSGRAAAK